MQFYDNYLNQDEIKKEYLVANSRCKYKTAEELQNTIEEYFLLCNQGDRPYTISGLALYLGLSTETLRQYEKKYGNTEYAEIIKVAKQRVEEYAERSLYDSRKSSGAKFVLENNFKWANKNEVTETVNIKLEDVL